MDFDAFIVFRRLLCLVVTAYTALRTAQTLLRWRRWLWSADRSRAYLRRYVAIQLLRVRLRRFGWDILQIVVLTAILYEVIRLH